MPSLTNKKQAQSFTGVINNWSKFSPRLSELAEPIRELSKEKAPFNWGQEHQQAFTQMKTEISSAPMLAYYNAKKQTVLQTDARIKGLAVCLLQCGKPVYFASKALTEAQKGMLLLKLNHLQWLGQWRSSTIFYILYASHFILETDQKLLEAIFSKNLNQATPKITVDTDQNLCLPLYSMILTWYYKSACQLFVPSKRTERFYQVA